MDEFLWMAEIHFTPPEKHWMDDSLVDTKQTMVPRGFKGVQDFVRPQYGLDLDFFLLLLLFEGAICWV